MFKDVLTKFERFFLANKRRYRVLSAIIILASLPLIYVLVLATGGIKYSYSHIMYIPIVLGGLILGKNWGLIIGIIAGILLGPALPVDTVTMEQQPFINWFFRLIIFTFVGQLSGLFATVLRKDLLKIVTLYSTNPETMIPNSNSLSLINLNDDENKSFLLTAIHINNNIEITELLGNNLYLEIVKLIHKRLSINMNNQIIIIQGGSARIWIASNLVDMQKQIDEILDILKEPIAISGIPLYIDFSVGATIIIGTKKLKDIASFHQCDLAARTAYKIGKPYDVFTPDCLVTKYDYELLGSFENALLENQTFLVFQPIYNLRNDKPEGFEALIRWQHPTKGLISPDKFVPSVEQTKLIHQLTDWVLHNVSKKIIEFKKNNIDISISLNISVKNLSNPNFFNSVINILEQYNIEPKNIELEITESMLMDNPNENISLLEAFLNEGISTSIDDFGIGYSSLQYLARLPIKVVKIDRFFISQMASEKAIRSIVDSTIKMSHNLGYLVVAEGIEDQETLDIAKALNCDYGQGYYLSRPMSGDKIIDWYKAKA